MTKEIKLLIFTGLMIGIFYNGVLGLNVAGASLLIVLFFTGLGWKFRHYNGESKSDWPKFLPYLFLLSLALSMPIHYSNTGKTITALGLTNLDDALMAIDALLLGWLFPQGQITLFLDQHAWLGQSGFIGKMITEVTQIFYLSYYVWGAGLLFILARRHSRATQFAEQRQAWTELMRFLCAWLGAYYINFIAYILVPAIGPQFVLKDQYQMALDGFGLRPFIQGIIAKNQGTLQDCFPSGHTALSWITALYALKLAPCYGRYCLISAIVITYATLHLRYHWVVDLLGAIPLVLAGLAWGSYWKIKKASANAV